MALFRFEDKYPNIHPDAFIAPTATLVGDVVVEAGASVWYGAVLRGDCAQVIVRAGANVQDGAVLHGRPGTVTEVGPNATVGHLCLVHGAVLGEGCMVANGSTVLDGATIGAGAMVAAHSLVPSNAVIPDGFLATGVPCEIRRPVEGSPGEDWVKTNAAHYAELSQRHHRGVEPVDDPA
ncbi:MAG TPA: gamma carbonic anhydrase family protein [Acidimicrobiales bacterium]|nr:gamma carbonic anhydrase family protein [Acidimicrobiales bacterium]